MASQRQYILHSPHAWLGETGARWKEADGPTRSSAFLVTDIGDCLVLKLSGFVQDQKATVEDVSENHLHLRVGGSWLRSLLSQADYPLDLEIQIHPAQGDQNPQSEVEVLIRDRRGDGQTSHFEVAARRIIWNLKHHLMAMN